MHKYDVAIEHICKGTKQISGPKRSNVFKRDGISYDRTYFQQQRGIRVVETIARNYGEKNRSI